MLLISNKAVHYVAFKKVLITVWPFCEQNYVQEKKTITQLQYAWSNILGEKKNNFKKSYFLVLFSKDRAIVMKNCQS